jgi:branched-chain amino acid transport system substrate-binding protein
MIVTPIVMMIRVTADDPQKLVLQKYVDDYTAFTGGDPVSTFGGHAWDGLQMIVAALGSLKDGMALADQRTAVREYLETKIVDWPGISGVFSMSAANHNGLTKDSLLFVKGLVTVSF